MTRLFTRQLVADRISYKVVDYSNSKPLAAKVSHGGLHHDKTLTGRNKSDKVRGSVENRADTTSPNKVIS